MRNDAPHSMSAGHQEWIDKKLRKGKPATKAKAPSLTDRLRAAVARLKAGEEIRRTKNTYAWDRGGVPISKGTVDTLISFGYLKGDPASALFVDEVSKPQLWVWTGKEYAA